MGFLTDVLNGSYFLTSRRPRISTPFVINLDDVTSRFYMTVYHSTTVNDVKKHIGHFNNTTGNRMAIDSVNGTYVHPRDTLYDLLHVDNKKENIIEATRPPPTY